MQILYNTHRGAATAACITGLLALVVSSAAGSIGTGVSTPFHLDTTSAGVVSAVTRSKDWIQVSPNPFAVETTVRFTATITGPVSLVISDVSGRRVRALMAAGQADAGVHSAVWDARDDSGSPVPAGVYFVTMQTNDRTGTSRIILVR
jgi:flagellar hook assembly protein FlgD